MVNPEENKEEIGKYLKKLIEKKFKSQREFCRKYLEIQGIPTDDENALQNLSNRISQIVNGNKSVQTYDLLIIAELLEISCEEILSAGKCSAPTSNRPTNYYVAFSKDENIWKQYIEREDKLILNSDEYGKTIIDYALEFKNFKFLKYLMEKKYIWFVNEKVNGYWTTFGAGTSIERPPFYQVYDLDAKLAQTEKFRIQMISLAIEHDDIEMLNELHAREIPCLYHAHYCFAPPDFECYYNEDMVIHISKASEQILDYFSEEFEITSCFNNKINTFLFPYMTELLDLLIKDNNKYSEKLLRQSIRHNRRTYNKLLKLIKNLVDSYDNEYTERSKDDIAKNVLTNFHFYDNGNIVSFVDFYFDTRTTTGLITNIIRVNQESEESEINSLIQKLNNLYNKISNLNVIYTYPKSSD